MRSRRTIVIAVLVMVILACVCAVGYALYSNRQKETAAGADLEQGTDDDIVYQGRHYRYNTDLKTVLFLGVDKSEEVSVENNPGQGGQSDTMLLFVMNQSEQTVTMLEVSRDTMADIQIYDMSGEYLASEHAQIGLQYAYGNSTKRSCQLAKEAVSKLLYEVPVRSHISLNVEGIAAIVDAIGGVKITVPQDYTVIDPAFTEGAEVVLDGAQAEAYVRYRDQAVVGSNSQRMERQNQFLEALIQQIRAGGMDAQSGYRTLLDSAGAYLDTDMTVKEIEALAEYEFSPEVLTLPGEMIQGETHDEFHVDDEKLYEMVLEVFYKPVN